MTAPLGGKRRERTVRCEPVGTFDGKHYEPEPADRRPCCAGGVCITLADLATRLWVPWCRDTYRWMVAIGHIAPKGSTR